MGLFVYRKSLLLWFYFIKQHNCESPFNSASLKTDAAKQHFANSVPEWMKKPKYNVSISMV